jgi:hypothetical protein
MKIEKDLQKTLAFDPNKVEQCYSDLVDVFRKHKLRVGEILIAYGNLGYTLGASIEGYDEKGPGAEELKQLHMTQPSPGTGLMIQGLTITTWYEKYQSAKVSNNEEIQENIKK